MAVSRFTIILGVLTALLGLLTYNLMLQKADLTSQITDLQTKLSVANQKPLVLENVLLPLCKENSKVDTIVTETITKIKEVPYAVETCNYQFDDSVIGVLDKAYYQLDLRRTP